jgi:hypothetical protein
LQAGSFPFEVQFVGRFLEAQLWTLEREGRREEEKTAEQLTIRTTCKLTGKEPACKLSRKEVACKLGLEEPADKLGLEESHLVMSGDPATSTPID